MVFGSFIFCLRPFDSILDLFPFACGDFFIGDLFKFSNHRPSIGKISKEMANKDKGLRDLIQAVVASESFLQN